MPLSQPLRILIVDDDVVDRQAVRRAFKATGLQVTLSEAAGADEALELLQTEAFDCCFLDLHLPGRDGFELLREARGRGIRTPVVMLTGHGSEEIAVELMKSGASDYLSKVSLSPQRLSYSVQHVLRFARAEAKTRAAELALRESEENFRRLAENLPDLVSRYDRERRYLYLNPAAARVTGLAPEAFLGKTNAELGFSAEHVALWNEAVDRAFRHETVQITVPFQALDGERFYEARLVREQGADGGPASVLCIARDVTETVQRQEVERRRAEFERQLIGIVSHDLRNPISAILIAATVLQRREVFAADERSRKAVARIIHSGERASRMIADLLDFTQARLGGGIPVERRLVSLRQVVEGVVAEIRTSSPDRAIQLEVAGDASGHWDGDRIAQVLANLLSNALKYGRADSLVAVGLVDTGSVVELVVTNLGDPIPADHLRLLFQPFQRGPNKADSSIRSIGLGLFIVEQIVKGHGGRIEVRSTEADGTTFRVILPRVADAAASDGAGGEGAVDAAAAEPAAAELPPKVVSSPPPA